MATNHFKIKIPDTGTKVKLQYRNKTTFLQSLDGFITISLQKGERAKMGFHE